MGRKPSSQSHMGQVLPAQSPSGEDFQPDQYGEAAALVSIAASPLIIQRAGVMLGDSAGP